MAALLARGPEFSTPDSLTAAPANSWEQSATSSLAQIIKQADAAKSFYAIMADRGKYYNDNRIFINQDFGENSLDGIYTRLYQIKRPKTPNNTYHLHIRQEACVLFEKFKRNPATDKTIPCFDDTRLRKEFGDDYATTMDKFREHNFELTLRAGKWHVETGEYEKSSHGFIQFKPIGFLRPGTEKLLATFPYDQFAQAKRFCCEYCDPDRGNLIWNEGGSGLRGKDFLGIVEYDIEPRAERGYTLQKVPAARFQNQRYKNLEKKFGFYETAEDARMAATLDYRQFKRDYFADKKFSRGFKRYAPNKVFERVNTRALVPDPVNEKYVWNQNNTGDYNLTYSGDNHIDYLICPEGPNYVCLKIENRLFYRTHVDVVNHPHVECIGRTKSLDKAKNKCQLDIAQEIKVRAAGGRLDKKTRLAMKSQSPYQEY